MIIVADAHVKKSTGNDVNFFQMLRIFEENEQDLIFLGDIFDLWFALPHYEENIHRNFLLWCREQKQYRTIGFIEGNHEFFLAEEQKESFTWCTDAPWWQDNKGNLFLHGDRLNKRDTSYLLFRKLIKNKTTKNILRSLPFGPYIVEYCKRGLKQTNQDFRKQFPKEEIICLFQYDFRNIFIGHFHKDAVFYNKEGKQIHMLPDWYSNEKVIIFDEKKGEAKRLHWRDLNSLSKHPTI